MILATAAVLVGLWRYEAYNYRGAIKAPTQTTDMIYEFNADGSDRLRWELLDKGNFCERTGVYAFVDGKLRDEIRAVNPLNHQSCVEDPDMKVGLVTEAPARIENSKLILTVKLSSEEIEMIFVRVETPAFSDLTLAL